MIYISFIFIIYIIYMNSCILHSIFALYANLSLQNIYLLSLSYTLFISYVISETFLFIFTNSNEIISHYSI